MAKYSISYVLLPLVFSDIGFSDSTHWAYKPIPNQASFQAQYMDGILSGIDSFIHSKLKEKGLKSAPRAELHSLVRRLSLDIIGLPPDPERVENFISDERPDRIERLVDELLASPHYGERWAKWWFDLARYADSDGYEKDAPRVMWNYRDWVIRTLNENLPFDQFTIEQLAGDMLPHADLQHKIASGFNRNSQFNAEGGVDGEEYRVAAVHDRVHTTATVWLGSTLFCSQCHNHKYDPFTQKDYYQFFAYFNNTDDHLLELPSGKIYERTWQWDEKLPEVSALILSERKEVRPTFIFLRGNFLNKGQAVEPAIPDFLKFPGIASPKNRLELARWIVSPENPLTGRVIVNRIWEQYFGRGLVFTTEDFGTQGETPTHPELLDWLASEFGLDWDLKRLHRLIVLSSTYQQSSKVGVESYRQDPDNRWLSRGPRFRVDAETIRDIALSASNLLSKKIGGPSVFPLQPDGIWTQIYSDEKWNASAKEDRYRRGLYTFWRRTAPYPSFTIFDSPSREVACFRRPRTNTPMQALVTLNDPVYFDAARSLGIQANEMRGTDEDRVIFIFKRCVNRAPTHKEMLRLLELYRDEREHARTNTALMDYLSPDVSPEHRPSVAAWSIVSNVILNLDETLTKE